MAHTPDPPPTAPAADEALAAPRRGFLAAGWAKFSDNLVPGVIVTFVAGLALISFSNIKSDIDGLEDGVNAKFSELRGEIATDFAAVDARFVRLEDDIDTRFVELEDEVNDRFTKLEENQQQIAVTLATLIGEFTAFREDVNNRFAAVDARFDAVDTRLAKLEENQREIAVTLARLVALFEAHYEVPASLSG